MKKLIFLFSLVLSLSASALGQYAVTATITDTPDGQAWIGGKYTITFDPTTAIPSVPPGTVTVFNGVLDGTGSLAVTLPSVTSTGAYWKFTLCPNASAPCVVAKNILVSASGSLSSTLSALATSPRFAAGPNSYGYLDAEVLTPSAPGGPGYFNVVSNTSRQWNGTAWQAWGGGGGSTPIPFVYIAPSGDTTGATDNAALQSAITAGKNIKYGIGNYYLTGVTAANAFRLECAGSGLTILNSVNATTAFFTVSYGGGQLNNESNGAGIYNCGFQPKSGVTPTAGDALNISGTSPTVALSGFHFEGNQLWGLWGGIRTGNYMVNNWFTNNMFVNFKSGGDGCIFYNTVTPGGDAYFDGDQCAGANTGVTIAQADTMEFTNLKTNLSGVVFTQAGSTKYVRFVNISNESAASGCGFDFGTGSNSPTGIYIQGGEIDLTATALCHIANATALTYTYKEYVTNAVPGGTPVLVSNLTPLNAGLLAAPNVNEGTGTTSVDNSPFGQNLTVTSGTWSGATSPLTNAVVFNGTTTHMDVPNNNTLNFGGSAPFTIATWVNLASSGGGYTIIGNLNSASNYIGWELDTTNHATTTVCPSGSCLSFVLSNNYGTNYLVVVVGATLSTSAWHQVTVVYNGVKTAAGFTIYVDGVVQTITATASTLTGTTHNTLAPRFGLREDGTGQPLPASSMMGPSYFWNRALAASEVANLVATPYQF